MHRDGVLIGKCLHDAGSSVDVVTFYEIAALKCYFVANIVCRKNLMLCVDLSQSSLMYELKVEN